jgi:uncharacterized membrane protein YkvA (DUF1232 family)
MTNPAGVPARPLVEFQVQSESSPRLCGRYPRRMGSWSWSLVAVATVVVLWAVVVVGLLLAGRGTDARALARFIPDCLVLMKRMLADPRVPRHRKLLLVGLLSYLALPFDLVPDFIPIAGQLDDVIVVALVLRSFVRADGGALVQEHWPGPEQTLGFVLRAAQLRT